MRKLKNEELGRKSLSEFKHAEKIPLVVVLDNVRSLNNIGAVFRTADAFLVEAIYLCGITATPPHKDIQKTALGATETVHWEYFADATAAIDKLKTNGYRIYAIEQAENSLMLNTFRPQPNEKAAIILGHEINGVSQELINIADACIEVPQYGSKHSLNIAVCAGIVMWDIMGKLTRQ